MLKETDMVSRALRGSVLVSLVVTLVIAGLYAVGVFPTTITPVFAGDPSSGGVILAPGAAAPTVSRTYTMDITNSTSTIQVPDAYVGVSSTISIDMVTLDVPPVGTGGSIFDVTAAPEVLSGEFGTTTYWTRSFPLSANNLIDRIIWSASTTDSAAFGIIVGAASTTFSFTASGPALAQTVTWTVTVRYSNNAEHTFEQTMSVEATAPTVTSIKMKDYNANGSIDAAEVTFSEEIDFTSINPAHWSIGGVATDGVAASTTLNTVVAFNLTATSDYATLATATSSIEIAGTAAPELTYVSGTAAAASTTADIAGNAVATFVAADEAETDHARPQVSSIENRPSGVIRITFTEDVTSVVLANFLAIGTSTHDIISARETTATSGIVDLTLGTSTLTGIVNVPTVTYTAGSLGDAAGNAVLDFSTVASDGVGPSPEGFAGLTTGVNTITVTFSEPLGGDVAKTDFTVAGNTVTTLATSTTAGPLGVATLTLGTAIDTDAVPVVTVAAVGDHRNNLSTAFSTTTVDTLGSLLTSITWTDVDTSQTINAADTILFVFSERMATGTIVAAAIDVDLVPDAGSYGSAPTLSWNTGETELTITLVGTPTIIAGATVNPPASVTDFLSNADATATTGPAVVQVTMSVTASPSTVVKNGTVTVTIAITAVTNFDAIAYNVDFDTPDLKLVSVAAGTIGATAIPVTSSATSTVNTATTTVRIVQNVSGSPGVSGSGTIATIIFTFIGDSGDASSVHIRNVVISDKLANVISSNTSDATVTDTLVLGDGNGDSALNALDITAVELAVAGTLDATPGADANADGTVNALDITKTEIIVAAQ